MSIVHISLGTNLGDCLANIAAALKSIADLPNTNILAVSALYQTEPESNIIQPDFFNCCAKIETSLTPHALLTKFLEIETALGRIRKEINGPRTIDIDLLLYDDLKINSQNLIVPHPRMFERDFVMVPLAEICDKYVHLANHKSAKIKKLEKSC